MKQLSRLYQRLAIIVVAVFIIVGVLAAVTKWHEIWISLDKANWEILPLALLLTGISYICLSFSFVLVNTVFGIPMSRRDLFDIGFVSTAMSHLVPAIGGYSVRLVLMQRRGVAVADIVSASIFHSYFNNLAMYSLLPVGLIYLIASYPLHHGEAISLGICIMILLFAIVVATLIVFSRSVRIVVLKGLRRAVRILIHRDIGPHLDNFDLNLSQGVKKMRNRSAYFILLGMLIIGDWVATVAVIGFCFVALGNSISIGVLLTGFAIGITAGVLSMIPGGLGIQDISMTGVYTLLGVPFENALVAALLFRVAYYFIPFLISIGFYPRLLRTKRYSPPLP